MVSEARLEELDSGAVPVTHGWFVINVRDAAWLTNDAFGLRCVFEGDKRGSLATLTAEGRSLLRKATNVHVRGLREHFLDHVRPTELEQLATVLEAVLAGEGSPLPPLPAR